MTPQGATAQKPLIRFDILPRKEMEQMMNEIKKSAFEIINVSSKLTSMGMLGAEKSRILKLAEAYLAEHPEDEDELITLTWMKETYGNENGQYVIYLDSNDPGQHINVNFKRNDVKTNNWDLVGVSLETEWDTFSLDNIKTRGQLRQLIKLLKGAE
jgi:hypothetical protein